MKKPELIILVKYGYRTKKELFAFVDSDPSIWVSGHNIIEVKNKLKTVIRKFKLPHKLIFKWKFI